MSDLSFNDASTSDIVVRVSGIAGEEQNYTVRIGFLDLYLHRRILVENSSYFSARLSDRWESPCKSRDASGRPILEVKEVGCPEDCATALQKLYERAPGDPEKCPVHSFTGFDDALRCLKAADVLSLTSVWASALAYLESIPWTDQQTEQLQNIVGRHGNSAAEKLMKRTDPAPASVRAALFALVVCEATPPSTPNAQPGSARSSVQEMMSRANIAGTPDKTGTQAFFAAGLRQRLSRMKEKDLPDMNLDELNPQAYKPYNIAPISATNLVNNLAWLLQLPHPCGEDDVRRDVIDVMFLVQRTCEPKTYEEVFYREIAVQLYLPVMKAVAEGSLVLRSTDRMDLLKMWVPARQRVYAAEDPRSKQLEETFHAVLSSMSRREQEEALHKWLGELVTAKPWKPWFKQWMETCLLGGTQTNPVRPRGFATYEPHIHTPFSF